VKSAHLATNEKNGNKVEFLRHLAFAGSYTFTRERRRK
jgi:hypothetical protein